MTNACRSLLGDSGPANGRKANIVTYEWGEYIKRAHAGEHDAMLIGWSGDNGDPDNWLGMLLGCDSVTGSNVAKFCYKPFDDLVKEGRETTDIGQRTRYYTEAQEMFAQQLPFSPIAHSTVYQPIRKNVTDFKIDPFGPRHKAHDCIWSRQQEPRRISRLADPLREQLSEAGAVSCMYAGAELGSSSAWLWH